MIVFVGVIFILLLSAASALAWQILEDTDGVSPLKITTPATQSHSDPRVIITDSPKKEIDDNDITIPDPASFQSGITYVNRDAYPNSVAPNETPVDNSYFDTALFLGDLFTAGIPSNLKGVYDGFNVIGEPTISLSTIYSTSNGDSATFLDLAAAAGTFETVYIMLGRNDINLSEEDFSEKYTAFVIEVRKIFPNAKIYLQSIIPSQNLETIELTKRYNLLIMNIATSTGSYFLDTASVFSDNEEILLNGATPDGNAINGEFYYRWFDYIKHHIIYSQTT